MADFVSDLRNMLMPQPAAAGGMTNYGAMPAQASPIEAILAKLAPAQQAQGTPQPGGASASGRFPGVTPPLGGGDMATAIASGVGAVTPGASGGAAFVQGLAGALGGRQQAGIQGQKLDILRNQAQLNALKEALQIRAMQGQQAARQAGAAALQGGLGGGGGPQMAPESVQSGAGGALAPGMPNAAPAPANGGDGAPPANGPSVGTVPLAPAQAGGGGDATPAPAAPAGGEVPMARIPHRVAASPDFWSNVDPNSNPAILDRKASAYERAAAAAANDPDTSKQYADSANQLRQRAETIRTRGMVSLNDNSQALIPGFATSKAQAAAIEAAAKTQAEEEVKQRYAKQIDPSGNEYLPGPGGSVGGAGGPAVGGPAPAAAPAPDGPKSLVVDPETAVPRSAIPAAPAGGGYPVPRLPPGAKLVGLGEGTKEIQKADAAFGDMVGKGPLLDQAVERYQSAAQALKLFQSGSGSEKLNAGAALAQSFGYPDIARRIQGGDPAAVQWLQKEGVGLTLDTLKAAQPKFAQQEFVTVSNKGVPNPDALPQANHQLISEGLGSVMRSRAFIQDWQKAQQQGWQSPSAFYSEWGAANPLSGFTRAAQRQIGTFKGMDLPAASDMTKGATYIAPTNMTDAQKAVMAKRGIQPGAMFRFNGKGADNVVEPVNPASGFSGHLEGQ